jgi:hypothetical protein
MRRLIFLDIDGVIAPGSTGRIDPTLLERLLTLVKETGAKVVLSSSWREDTLRKSLRLLPTALRKHVEGQTRDLQGQPRGKEICSYLQEHPCHRYVILDDEPEPLYAFLHDKAVFTNPKTGLSEEDAAKAKEILMRS